MGKFKIGDKVFITHMNISGTISKIFPMGPKAFLYKIYIPSASNEILVIDEDCLVPDTDLGRIIYV